MAQLKNPTVSARGAERENAFDELTRDQRTVLARLAQRFREEAAVQYLVGPHESGKTTVAQALCEVLQEETVGVLISRGGDQNPTHKRVMMEAYGSYPHFLTAILKQLGFFARSKDKDGEDDLVVQMVEQLRNIRSEDRRLLLIIDEAQDISPGVWKRFQSWLDYQDRGKRMIQVLLVGSPVLKKAINDPSMRGWRRWIHGKHELGLLSTHSGREEIRRILKQVCDRVERSSESSEPVPVPSLSWLASRRIVSESGGRPGRLSELSKRVLSASLRQGGCRITRRFLAKSDALRSPAMDLYKLKRLKKPSLSPTKPETEEGEPSSPGARENRPATVPPAHPLGWMRFALGALLLVFVLGAGWGITAWLSIPPSPSEGLLAEGESTPDTVPATEEGAIPEMAEESSTQVADTSADPWGDAYSTPATDSVSDRMLEEVSPWDAQQTGESGSAEEGWQSADQVTQTAPLERAPMEQPVWGSEEGAASPAAADSSPQPVTAPPRSVDETLASVEALGIQLAEEPGQETGASISAPTVSASGETVVAEAPTTVLPEMPAEAAAPPAVTEASSEPPHGLAIEGPAPTVEVANSFEAPVPPPVIQAPSPDSGPALEAAGSVAAPLPAVPTGAAQQDEPRKKLNKQSREALLKKLDRLEKTLKG